MLNKLINFFSNEITFDSYDELSENIFSVDWREDDEDITKYCEYILKTETLSSKWVNSDSNPKLIITYENKSVEVPILLAPEDRHITLVTLNKILQPKYEIRVLVESTQSDTLDFLPLETEIWKKLEEKFSIGKVQEYFAPFHNRPNLFTLGFSYQPPKTWQELATNGNKMAAIKLYQKNNDCSLSEAKNKIDAFIDS